jgi:hypothetical protein
MLKVIVPNTIGMFAPRFVFASGSSSEAKQFTFTGDPFRVNEMNNFNLSTSDFSPCTAVEPDTTG